jgi:imidazolonepropionase-like amidohydrolase
MMADLLVVDGNPLEDISELTDPERVQVVIRGGHIAHAAPLLLAT